MQMIYHKTKADSMWIALMKMGAKTGCHQRADRSFFFRGYQFPVCARCCGVLCGEMIAVLVKRRNQSLRNSVFLMGIMFSDWLIQYLEIYESNNRRRFLTGMLGGYGAWAIYLAVLRRIIAMVSKTE